MPRNFRARYPLLSRIIVYIFVFAFLVSLLVVGIQLYFSFLFEKQKVVEKLDQFGDTQLETLVNSVWSLDLGSVEIQLNGILEDPDIVHVWLRYKAGTDKMLRLGAMPGEKEQVLIREYDLKKRVETEEILIGRVGFVATTANISSKLLQLSSSTLAAELITIIVTCLFILVLFFFLYSRHINRIVSFTEDFDLEKLDDELWLRRARFDSSRQDEIDRIVAALNNMRLRLKEKIEAQKEAEKNLFQEKIFSDTIINSLPGIFFVCDRDMRIIRSNRVYLDFFNLAPERVYGHDLIAQVVEHQVVQLGRLIKDLFENREPFTVEIGLTGGDLKEHPFLLTARPIEIGGSSYLVGIGSDLTDQKMMESQLRQAQKMEAIGTLAGGISHDFNNILSAIVGFTNLARLESAGNEKLQGYLGTVAEASDRAKTLVQQILSFSRKTETSRKPLNISENLNEALKLLRSSIPSHIQITESIAPGLYAIADQTEIQQVIMNLATNAYQAIQDNRGTISISLSERLVTENESFSQQEVAQGHYLVLEVGDTGQGMDEATMEKIFEPYFTTKGVGVGTGLGLAVVHGIISNYNGAIKVESNESEGTVFTILLPALVQEAPASQKRQQPEPACFGNAELIMVVDDEEVILEFYSELLERYGYRTACFSDSMAALDFFKAKPDDVDLVISDQVMPVMQGDELAEKIWLERPDLPIVLCSGFSGSLGRQDFLEKGFAEYIQKPVNGMSLLQILQDILNEPGTAS